MNEEIGRPPPLEDWEKALLLVGIANHHQVKSGAEACKWLARLTDWPLNRAEQAMAEAHLKGMIEPFKE